MQDNLRTRIRELGQDIAYVRTKIEAAKTQQPVSTGCLAELQAELIALYNLYSALIMRTGVNHQQPSQ